MQVFNHAFCVAPMMGWTNRHCRYFHRLLTKKAVLYTEMISTGALIHGDRDRFLHFNPQEAPVALQIGGSDYKELAQCAKMVEQSGYNEINLNVGCPSSRVQNARIGACLMADPSVVSDCIKAMKDSVDIPVTIKHRIGIDSIHSYEALASFVDTIHQAGCQIFIVHARVAMLDGLSPKQNREIPPLQYDLVYQLKKDFPHLTIIINGGLTNFSEIDHSLQYVDGVMLGREAYKNPYLLAKIDQLYYTSDQPILTRSEIVERMQPYIDNQIGQGAKLSDITKHMLGLYHQVPGTNHFKRYLSESAHKKNASYAVLYEGMEKAEKIRMSVSNSS